MILRIYPRGCHASVRPLINVTRDGEDRVGYGSCHVDFRWGIVRANAYPVPDNWKIQGLPTVMT